MILVEKLGAAYKAVGNRLRTYPAHPSLIRNFNKAPEWGLLKMPGTFSPRRDSTSAVWNEEHHHKAFGGRPCAVFQYKGEAMDEATATRLLA